MLTYDQRTIDSAGAFLVGELDRLDPTIHLPLSSVTWQRDVDLRDDVTMGDETSSYTVTSLGASGSAGSDISWIAGSSTEIGGVSADISKVPHPLHLWGRTLGWTIPELQSSIRLGRPIEAQKLEGLKLKHQMDADKLVYLGDKAKGSYGLINNPVIPPYALSCDWTTAPAEDILIDVNRIIMYAWERSGCTVCPDQIRVPPLYFGGLSRLVSQSGTMTILDYITKMCAAVALNGRPLVIHPVKWLSDAGVSKKGRVVLYTRNKEYVRFPMVPLQKTPLELRGIHQLTTYFGKFGELETPYPETLSYADVP